MKPRSCNAHAVSLLARREHSLAELYDKLSAAGHDADAIQTTLDWLKTHGLQDDRRFAEAFIRSRSQRGQGIQRIQQELKQRGVSASLIKETLQQAEIDWFALAVAVRCKRFGEQVPDNYTDRARQIRFLQYRGFTHEQITESFNALT